MAPNRLGLPPSDAPNGAPKDAADYSSGGAISKEEIEARGAGTTESFDSYSLQQFWRCERRVFFTGLMFLTRLPCPSWCDHHPAYLMRSLQWFPLFGAIIGVWAAVWLQAAAVLWGPAAAAAISTLASVWLTGCFHEDGLADSFDGFGGGWTHTQILRIMKDSRVGTYALVGMSLVLFIKLKSLEALQGVAAGGGDTALAAAALVAVHAVSRWSSLPLIYFCTYLQDEEDAKRGLYNHFADSARLLKPPRLALGTLTALVVPWAVLGLQRALLLWAIMGAVTVAAGLYSTAILGGVVGDFLGATIQVCEVCCYLALTADWAAAAVNWRPLAVLAAVAALPVLYTRRVKVKSTC